MVVRSLKADWSCCLAHLPSRGFLGRRYRKRYIVRNNINTCGHGRVPGTLEAWHHRVVGWLKNMSNHGSELKDHATMVYLDIHDLDTAKLAFTTATAKVG